MYSPAPHAKVCGRGYCQRLVEAAAVLPLCWVSLALRSYSRLLSRVLPVMASLPTLGSFREGLLLPSLACPGVVARALAQYLTAKCLLKGSRNWQLAESLQDPVKKLLFVCPAQACCLTDSWIVCGAPALLAKGVLTGGTTSSCCHSVLLCILG